MTAPELWPLCSCEQCVKRRAAGGPLSAFIAERDMNHEEGEA